MITNQNPEKLDNAEKNAKAGSDTAVLAAKSPTSTNEMHSDLHALNQSGAPTKTPVEVTFPDGETKKGLSVQTGPNQYEITTADNKTYTQVGKKLTDESGQQVEAGVKKGEKSLGSGGNGESGGLEPTASSAKAQANAPIEHTSAQASTSSANTEGQIATTTTPAPTKAVDSTISTAGSTATAAKNQGEATLPQAQSSASTVATPTDGTSTGKTTGTSPTTAPEVSNTTTPSTTRSGTTSDAPTSTTSSPAQDGGQSGDRHRDGNSQQSTPIDQSTQGTKAAQPGSPAAPTESQPGTKVGDPTQSSQPTRPTDQPQASQPTRPTDQPQANQPTTRPTDQPQANQPTTRPTDQPQANQPTTRPTDQPQASQPATKPADQPQASQPTTKPADQPQTSQPTGKQADQVTQPATQPSDKTQTIPGSTDASKQALLEGAVSTQAAAANKAAMANALQGLDATNLAKTQLDPKTQAQLEELLGRANLAKSGETTATGALLNPANDKLMAFLMQNKEQLLKESELQKGKLYGELTSLLGDANKQSGSDKPLTPLDVMRALQDQAKTAPGLELDKSLNLMREANLAGQMLDAGALAKFTPAQREAWLAKQQQSAENAQLASLIPGLQQGQLTAKDSAALTSAAQGAAAADGSRLTAAQAGLRPDSIAATPGIRTSQTVDDGLDTATGSKQQPAQLGNLPGQKNQMSGQSEEDERKGKKGKDERDIHNLSNQPTQDLGSMLGILATDKGAKVKDTKVDTKKQEEEARRKQYLVQQGDTLESIATEQLGDAKLSQLIAEINNNPTLHPGMEIWLPTKNEIKDFRKKQISGAEDPDKKFETPEEELAAWQSKVRQSNVEAVLGPLSPSSQDSERVKHTVRLGDTLRSIAMKHPALQDVKLWKLIAELNQLPTAVDAKGVPTAALKRGTSILIPTVTEVSKYRKQQGIEPSQPISSKSKSGSTQSFEIVTKPCPECKSITTLDATICPKCGHTFESNADDNKSGPSINSARKAPTVVEDDADDPTSTILKAAGLASSGKTKTSAKSAGSSKLAEKDAPFGEPTIETLADTCQLAKSTSKDGGINKSCLNVCIDGKWQPVVAYEISNEVSVRHEYSSDGKRRTIRIDLPPQAVQELSDNDLTSNWKNYQDKFLSGSPITD